MAVDGASSFTREFARSAWPNSLVGSIAEWLACAIVEGRLRPGESINSVTLAKQFQASRASVREAFLLLEGEGLIEIVLNHRPRVKPISLSQARHIYQVRATLYGLVAELIVAHASDAQIESLRELLLEMKRAAEDQDVDQYFWANVAFRAREAEICGNPELKRILNSLGLRALQLRHISLSAPDLHRAHDDHETLVRAYASRNTVLASALARSAVLEALARIERASQDAGTPGDTPVEPMGSGGIRRRRK